MNSKRNENVDQVNTEPEKSQEFSSGSSTAQDVSTKSEVAGGSSDGILSIDNRDIRVHGLRKFCYVLLRKVNETAWSPW